MINGKQHTVTWHIDDLKLSYFDSKVNNKFILTRTINYLQATKKEIASTSTNNIQTINWYVDIYFAMYRDMKSHTGAIMTLGRGAIILDSTKQKENAKSSTKNEIIAVDNTTSKV
jgi:flagellar biosynthesis regulator FlaF